MGRVLVMGMGRSGVAAAELALRLGAKVTCTDQKADAPRLPDAEHAYGEHREYDFRDADLVVVSPGVPARHPMLEIARDAGAEVVSELGFAFRHLTIPVLAVTGTNGKSTTTFLLGQILGQLGYRPFVGGNLGTALSTAVGGDHDIAAVEVSSYQLELAGTFRPRAAAILNLQPDHLGRHGTLETYAATKCRIFEHMGPQDWAVVGPSVPGIPWPLDDVKGRLFQLGGSPGVAVVGSSLRFTGTEDDGLLDLSSFPLLGHHNALNLGAAVLLAMSMGAKRSELRLGPLTGLPHRLEVVVEGPVRFINDSKATNVDAALIGIGAVVSERPGAIVLLGGEGKEGADYGRLLPVLAAAGGVICFGASGSEIATAIADCHPHTVKSLEDAVPLARDLAGAEGTVVLSPACASFDEFDNFEHRGARFRMWATGKEIR